MTASDPDEVQTLLQNARTALKGGDKTTARSLAERAAALAPGSEEPWLVLAAAATSPGQSLAYIKRALQLTPESIPAQQALEWTLKKQRESFQAPPLSKPPVPIRRTSLPVSSQKTASPVANRAVPMEASSQPKTYPGGIPHAASPEVLGDTAPHGSQSRSPTTGRKNFSFSPSLILGLFLLGVLVFSGFLALLFGEKLPGGLTQVLQPLRPEPTFPTITVPTPDCGSPNLVIGTTTFQIQNLARAADGSWTVSPDTSGIAYWVEGTDHNYIFVLSPTPDNASIMSTITAGSTAKVTWKNCNSSMYSLSAPQQGSFNSSALTDQSIEGITVFFQTDSSGAGFVFKGELAEQQIIFVDTPAPGELEVQANIGLLETISSSDGTTIRIGVSINNYGGSLFTLSARDASLIQGDSTPLAVISSEPPLPKDIAPRATETIYFTFPRPASATSTLKIFTVEYDIEGY